MKYGRVNAITTEQDLIISMGQFDHKEIESH